MPLDTGDKAPDFTLPTDGGGELSLSSLKGRKVVLYFYPKDDTSGCTKEAIGFTDMVAEFDAADTVIWDEAENRLHAQKALMETLLLANR